MQAGSSDPRSERTPLRDRGFMLLIGGALALVVLGLISIPLTSNRQPTLAPETAPEGVVQRFYQALFAGEYQAAYAWLSTDAQQAVPFVAFQQQLSTDLQNAQVRTGAVTVQGATATVHITMTHIQPDALFGTGEWQNEQDVVLMRGNAGWRISSGPFYLPAVR